MVSVASAGGRRMRAVPPVPVPAVSRTVPVRMLAALLGRVWRAGSVSVLLGEYMREIDPDIEDLLPEIIDELAQLWTTDPVQMLAEFRRRAGV
jgi:hypothetical protein